MIVEDHVQNEGEQEVSQTQRGDVNKEKSEKEVGEIKGGMADLMPDGLVQGGCISEESPNSTEKKLAETGLVNSATNEKKNAGNNRSGGKNNKNKRGGGSNSGGGKRK